MNCRRVNQLLSAYMDGELPGVEHRLIHEHLAHCTECREEHDSLHRTKMLLSRMRTHEPRPDMVQAIQQRLGSEKAPAPHRLQALRERLQALPGMNSASRNFAMGAGLAAVGILFAASHVESPDEIQWNSRPTETALLTANAPALDGPSLSSAGAVSRVEFERGTEPALPDAEPSIVANDASATHSKVSNSLFTPLPSHP